MIRKSLATLAFLLALCMPAWAFTASPTLSAGGGNTGLVSSGLIGYTLLSPTDGSTIIQARTTTGIIDLGGGNYVIAPVITITDGTAPIIKWDRSDTSAILGAASITPTSISSDIKTRVTTALPAIAPGAAGGLPTGDSSGHVTVATNLDKTSYTLAVPPPTSAQIADAIWQALTTAYTTAGSTGYVLGHIVTIPTNSSTHSPWDLGSTPVTRAAAQSLITTYGFIIYKDHTYYTVSSLPPEFT